MKNLLVKMFFIIYEKRNISIFVVAGDNVYYKRGISCDLDETVWNKIKEGKRELNDVPVIDSYVDNIKNILTNEEIFCGSCVNTEFMFVEYYCEMYQFETNDEKLETITNKLQLIKDNEEKLGAIQQTLEYEELILKAKK